MTSFVDGQTLTAAALNTAFASVTGTAYADQFVGNGSQTTFTLSATPGSLFALGVFVGGVAQTPTADYTWGGSNTITFVAAPPFGATILVRYPIALPTGTSNANGVTYTPGYSGAIARTVQVVLDTLPVDWVSFGADPTGVADSTSAIIAAAAASLSHRPSPGRYLVSSSIAFRPNTVIDGTDPDACQVYRTGNYGDTFTCGSSSVSALSFTVKNLWFCHSSQYVQGVNSLPNLATSGAHLRLWGSQNVTLERCYFWRLPYSVIFHGGSVMNVDNCTFIQTWDPLYPAAQEGVQGVVMDASTTWGNPKDLRMIRNNFLGTKSAARSVTITDANGHSATPTYQVNIGPQQHLYVNGCETITAEGNYFGTASDADVFLNPSAAGFVANARFVDNFFDGAQVTHFRAQIQSGGQPILHLTLSDNGINGEANSLHGFDILAQVGAPSVYDLTIADNKFNALVGTPMVVTGAVDYDIHDNTMSNYNCLGVTPSSAPIDAQFASAGYFAGPDSADYFGQVHHNEIGGGGNYESTTGNNCWLPFYSDPTVLRVAIYDNTWVGVGATPQYGRQEDVPLFVTAATYTGSAYSKTYLVAYTATGAVTFNLPAHAPAGCEQTIKDIGTAAAHNITLTPASGDTIESAASLVMSTNLQCARLKYNGNGVWYQV